MSSVAYGQATRTWVSGVGDDANPCSRTAPCKTFAGAISKTAAGGIIDALDPGGFGALTITKPITIEGQGTLASVLASSGVQGIVINIVVGSTTLPRVVVLRDLLINGTGPTLGTNGINFIAGDALVLDRVDIENFTNNGILFQPGGGGTAHLDVRDSHVAGTGGGILVVPQFGTSARADIANTRLSRNGTFGLRTEDNGHTSVFHSTAELNTNNGFFAFSNTGAAAVIDIQDSASVNNGNNGIKAQNTGATVRLSNVEVTGNNVGLAPTTGGDVQSWQNNHVAGNTTADGTPTTLLNAK
ncbi:MAG TPA: right-handed parallel beta-helix repeat-containing protein [Gemmatimonadaceae bacterium]